jgi:SAM-dependent methyltransferase
VTVFDEWLLALEARHLSDLTFSEAARALRALSSTYVERRERLAQKSALDSAGKRAAYALYYSPLHFITMREVLRGLELEHASVRHVLDLGCGAGAAGAAWAALTSPPALVTGVDAHPWALAEAAFTYRSFGLVATTKRGDVARTQIPRHVDAIAVGWVLNEVNDEARDAVQHQLLHAHARGAHVLVVEPIATRVSPWWRSWTDVITAAGGRADEWRFRVTLPDLLKRFDRAAHLRHDVLTARTFYLPGRATSASHSLLE